MLDKTIAILETFIAALGKTVALFVLAIIGLMIFEMVSRGVFSHSVAWAGDVSTWLLVSFIFLGGPWAMARGKFVRVDALYERFSPLAKAIIDTTVSTILFALFIGVLLKLGGEFALKSFAMGERSATGNWGGPLWLPKAMMPVGAALLCVAWLLNLLRLWRDALRPGADGAADG
jgi:TRAP-type mannitol/chloroaromatic compound transport system permease small subunit